MAQRSNLFDAVDLDSSRTPVRCRHLPLYARRSPLQLGTVRQVRVENQHQRLVTTGIRSRVRHPVYLGHLCEMLAWSFGTGLAVCWLLTAFAIATGAVMIRMEDAELEKRFGDEYRGYRSTVPAVVPRI
jgi:protein-S-isoprenylcysteine O-methyltransferase Ste14